MTTAYTSLLGLALPVQGELQGTWGDTVNTQITQLLDSAVAGTTTLSTDADVTLTTTMGAANQARQAILLWTANGTTTRNITAPAQSKIYTVINNSAGTQSIVIRGVGPTTGVTIPKGKAVQVVWNGSDFVELSPNSITGNLTVNGNLTVTGNTTLGDATADTLTVNALVNSNLLFTDGTYNIGASGANRPAALFLASNNASFNTPLTAVNLASGGGGFGLNLFAGSLGNAVAGDSLIYNGVGNLIISPNAASKKLVFVAGTWTNTPTLTIDGANLLVNTQTNYTASPNLYVYGGPGTLMTVGGLNHFSTGAGGNNNGFIGGGYYNTSSNLVATHTSAAQYQNASGSHVFYGNTGLTVGNTYTNIRRMTIDGTGPVMVSQLTTPRANILGSYTPYFQMEGSNNDGLRFASMVYGSTSTTGPIFVLAKTRTATSGGNAAVQANDELGQLNFDGADGTNIQTAVNIIGYADGTVSSGVVPGRLQIQTANSAGNLYDRYKIDSGGNQYWVNVGSSIGVTAMSLTSGIFTTYNTKIESQSNASSGFDSFQIYGTGYSTNQKYWRTKTQNGILQHQTLSDDYLTERTYMYVNRSGVNVQSISLNTGPSSATRLYIQDSTGEVIVGYSNSLSSDNRFAVSNNGAIGFEVAPGTVSGYADDVRLLSYNRSTSGYKNLQYSAYIHKFIANGTTSIMEMDSGSVNINPQGLTASYAGYFKVLRNSASVGQPIATFQQNAASSSEEVNITAINGSYTNSSTPGWGMLRLLVDRGPSSVFNYLTCVAGSNTNFYLRGDGNAYADGTWNNNGADYAEYFESASGQEIPVGTSVVLDGNKVRAATEQDTQILGVVRPKKDGINSMVVGNTAWGGWANKYLTDDFGCFIMEDFTLVEWTETLDEWEKHPDPAMGTEGIKKTKFHQYTVGELPDGVVVPADAVYKTHDSDGVKLERRKLNPAWDESVKYVPREKRPEWLIIGLLGQIRILKGQPVGSDWVKMRDISASVEEWFVK